MNEMVSETKKEIERLDKKHNGASFTFCSRSEMSNLINIARREGMLRLLPSNWIYYKGTWIFNKKAENAFFCIDIR